MFVGAHASFYEAPCTSRASVQLINIILVLKRLEPNAFFCMNNVRKREKCRLPRVFFTHCSPLPVWSRCPLKAFPGRVQWGGQQSRTKGYFVERGRVVTNYEQLITPRWHFVEQGNTIKHGGWISGGVLEGTNSAPSMTKWITLNFPKDQNLINTLEHFIFSEYL